MSQSWQPLGPSPLYGGQNENITDRPVIGAIHGIAPHPTDSDIIYVATVNGGIWKTVNATAASPTWIPQTDSMSSMSMGDVEFDVTDATFQTLVAGSGRFSSLASTGGDRAGVFRTTDGGTTWVDLNGGMDGRNIASVEARGSILLAAVDRADSFLCSNIGVFRSTDTGANWTLLTSNEGIPRGGASSLVADPLDDNTFYAGVNTYNGVCSGLASGIYKTTDAGVSWNKVSDAAMEAVIGTRSCHFEIAVGRNVGTNPGETGNVFVSMVCSGGTLTALYRSGDAGGTWTAMDIPETFDNEGNNGAGGVVGLHPGGQGNLHSSIAADPTNDNIVYIGGDRQPFGFPNSLGANDYSGRLFRGDASLAQGSQMTPLTHVGTANNSAPHADSRDMQFDSDGNLLESDDGGIYKRLLPRSTTGDWFSLNGDLAVTEQHDAYYDANSEIVVSGNQDNGTSVQSLFASTTWNNYFNADGGDVVVDDISLAGSNQSVRFYSFQNLSAFTRVVYDQNNNLVSSTGPTLTVINGAPFFSQFVTPLAINNTNGNRMIIGGGNSVYESADHGDTISEIGPGIYVVGTGRNNIAYGASDNEDILFVGACQADCSDAADGDDGVFVRTTDIGALTHVYTPTSGVIQGVTVNPNDSTEAFIIEDSMVLHTNDTGGMWSDITGDLTAFGRLRSIEFLPDDNNSKLVVGSNRGVFISEQSDGYNQWTAAAMGMPNTPVFELHYDANSDRLIAGTFGRGAFVLESVMGVNSPPVIGSETISVAKGGTTNTVDGGATSLIVNDTDPDIGDVLTMETTAVTEPMNGLLTLNDNGTFSYQHDNSYTNSDQFFYRVCDDGNPSMCADGQVDVNIDLGGAVCRAPNLAIPDNDSVTGVSDTLVMGTMGTLVDLDVFLEINHTWVGDVTVSLTHVSSGKDVILLERPGNPVTANGCDEADISATLDDDSATPAEDQCETPIAITGTLSPTELLSEFNGEELSGNWTLKVTDSVGGDEGTLISWCLSPNTGQLPPQPPILDSIGNQDVDELTNLAFTVTASDADTAQNNLVFSLSGEPTGASITSGGDFSFTPTEVQGPGMYTFDVIVSDDSMPALTDTETITITVAEVNDFPVIDPIASQTVEVLETLSFTVTATDPDIPAQTLTFSMESGPAGMTISNDGDLSFTPTFDQGPATYVAEVKVKDGTTFVDIESFSVEVTNGDLIFKNDFEDTMD